MHRIICLRSLRFMLAPCLFAFVGAGCVGHVLPYKVKRRTYELPVPHTQNTQGRAAGSLFEPGGLGSRLTTDARAQDVNDLVVIKIDERATAERDTSTETSREDAMSSQLTAFMGMVAKLDSEYPDFNGTRALELAHKAGFKGQGSTSRNDRLQATVPALVRRVLPNGNLFVEGHRVVLVNKEEHHFYISGVVRPDDIDGAGQVLSSRIADAQIEFVGRGELTAASSKGWLSRVIDVVWPL